MASMIIQDNFLFKKALSLISHQNPELFFKKVHNIVQKVGHYQMSHFRSTSLNFGQEKAPNEFFSEIDVESERKLRKNLLELIPHAGLYGEELGQNLSGDYLWIIDPIDGTNNFLSGLDQFCISVALSYQNQIIFGIVYKPSTEETFHAFKGQGLYHNLTPLKAIKEPVPPKFALIGTGFPYRNRETLPMFHQTVEQCLTNFRGLRRFGSAALDLSYVAAGFLQGFWETGLQPYDVAAALLFLQENNCLTTNFHGNDYQMGEHIGLVSGVPGVFEALQSIVHNSYPDIH